MTPGRVGGWRGWGWVGVGWGWGVCERHYPSTIHEADVRFQSGRLFIQHLSGTSLITEHGGELPVWVRRPVDGLVTMVILCVSYHGNSPSEEACVQ